MLQPTVSVKMRQTIHCLKILQQYSIYVENCVLKELGIHIRWMSDVSKKKLYFFLRWSLTPFETLQYHLADQSEYFPSVLQVSNIVSICFWSKAGRKSSFFLNQPTLSFQNVLYKVYMLQTIGKLWFFCWFLRNSINKSTYIISHSEQNKIL